MSAILKKNLKMTITSVYIFSDFDQICIEIDHLYCFLAFLFLYCSCIALSITVVILLLPVRVYVMDANL